jgi:hypothetical protein
MYLNTFSSIICQVLVGLLIFTRRNEHKLRVVENMGQIRIFRSKRVWIKLTIRLLTFTYL